jgi:hypothetical protein
MQRQQLQSIIETPISSLPSHTFLLHTMGSGNYKALTWSCSNKSLCYMLEVYMDNYSALTVPYLQEQLDHIACGVMKGILDVFPEDPGEEKDPMGNCVVSLGKSNI